MGLDNGFQLRNKKTGKTVDLYHFRKYYELADYFRGFKMLPKFDGTEGKSYNYPVNAENLTTLKQVIEPIYNTLIKLPANTVAYYDEELGDYLDSSDKWLTKEEYESTDWSFLYYFK